MGCLVLHYKGSIIVLQNDNTKGLLLCCRECQIVMNCLMKQ